MLTVDINCDMGEGVGNDAAIMPYISSANIACGYHAGDEQTMQQTIALALRNNVSIGAHPSFFDRRNFGRVEMNLRVDEIYDLVILQLRMIDKFVRESNSRLHHVKPHGALYNMSAKDSRIAQAIAQGVKDFDDQLVLFVLSGSDSKTVAEKLGLRTASEVFADRTYQDDGSLTSRSLPNALVENEASAVQQALQMVKQKTVTTVTGRTISLVADTICLHGDGIHAVQFARAINEKLKMEGVQIESVD